MRLLQSIGTQLAKFLTREHIHDDAYYRPSFNDLKSVLEPGDVVLVEGKSRVSNAIQFITSSDWSHAAIFIGKTDYFKHSLIEVKAVEGCKYTDINTYKQHTLRICRPMFLNKRKRRILLSHLVTKIGSKYDLKNIIDLIRYVYPNPPVPKKVPKKFNWDWRRRPHKSNLLYLNCRSFQGDRPSYTSIQR